MWQTFLIPCSKKSSSEIISVDGSGCSKKIFSSFYPKQCIKDFTEQSRTIGGRGREGDQEVLKSRGHSAYKEKKEQHLPQKRSSCLICPLFICLSHLLHLKLLHDKNVSSPQNQPTKKPDLNMSPSYRNPALRWGLECTAEVSLFLKIRKIQLSGNSQI